MELSVQQLLKTGAAATDEALERLLPGPEVLPHSIHRAMRHSTFAGGKRIRPILCIEAARMISGGTLPPAAANLGAALEMLHTYSLIHDDLPALDNDDLRRGQPTCHVAFGEATAILAGDALQTLAFQTIAALDAPSKTVVAILREVAAAVGTGVGQVGTTDSGIPPGMIGGQVMDLESERLKPTAELVEAIHRAKTGALITVSVLAGGLLALGTTRRDLTGEFLAAVNLVPPPDPGEHAAQAFRKAGARRELYVLEREDTLTRLRTFGQKAGLAFQIVDDVLDVTQNSAQLGKTAGKDTASDKATWPAVFGIAQSIHDADQLIADAFAALEPFGHRADPLKALARFLTERKS